MTLYYLLKSKDLYRKSGCRYVGPCPKCGGSSDTTRFVTKEGSDTGKCFSCGWGCDRVGYLREIEGLSCKQAWAALGEDCNKTACPVFAKCHNQPAPRVNHSGTARPALPAAQTRTATEPTATANIWREKATALVSWAHAQLLTNPEQLAYLAGRGLDMAAVQHYRLGWLPADLYRERAAWGLPEELKDNGQPKKLWLPLGLTIPTFGANGSLQRVRIRRPVITGKEPRYYWLPGSGNGTTILSPGRRAAIIIESDLDAILIDHLAGDLVTTLGLGTSSADPKTDCAEILDNAVIILIALDADQAGDKGWQKWQASHPQQAERLIVPVGKDPGEAWQKGCDLRQWIIDALPISLHPHKQPAPVAIPGPIAPIIHTVTAKDGRHINITDDADAYRRLAAEGKIVFNSREIALVKQTTATPEETARFLDAKELFPGATIEKIIKEAGHDNSR